MGLQKSRKNLDEPKRFPAPPNLRAVYGDGLVTRAIAAFILGISKSELIRREKDGIYPHISDEKGVSWYVEEDIRKIAGVHGRSARALRQDEIKAEKVMSPHAYTGQTAAIVFKELTRGRSLEEIVMDSGVHPESVLVIAEVHARMKGCILLGKKEIEEIGKLNIRGAWPPKTPLDLLTVLKSSLVGFRCARCAQRPARLCGACAPPGHIQEPSNGAPSRS